MPDISSATYTPPGVYVSDESTPTVTPRGVSTTTVTVIGPALGYQTTSEVVTVFSASATALAQRGVYTTAVVGPPAIAAPVVTTLSGTAMVYNTDYTFVVTAGSGGAATAITSIKRLSSSQSDLTQPSPNGLKDGDQVRVTYAFTNATYYEPTEFEDYDQVVATYGQAMVSTSPTSPTASQVASALTLAAKIALENGAASVLCVATNPSAGDFRAQLQAAYSKLEADYRAQILVPLFVDGTYNAHTPTNVANMLADVKNHCETAADDGYGRMAFTGLATTYDNTTGHDQLALAQDSKRLVLCYPNRLLAFNSAVNASTEVDGFYLAAAMAGRLARNAVARGLTNQSLTSFTGLPATIAQAMTRTFKNNLSKSGVNVAEINQNNQLVARHGVSTNMSSILTQEISLTRIGDVLLQMIQVGMSNAGLIGEPITAETTINVKSALIGLLEQAVSDAIIVSYANAQVRQQSADPSVIEGTFSYKPPIPMNYVVVKFAVDLTTGDTSTETDQTA
ncbi:hypothetical protein FNV58_00560 (plasmid) [Streptomyces sp. RLB1-9]|uniref:hypothetical protein n=1 Tax=Streptomyces sp. RLB1-9 TaxID=2594454 RepID=UPI0011658ED2|nr:hypothetical protein [Streptomyces sp. RLB1-9]QDN95024.1 hypothetical protein FNV58_00560 [Streptomyces sp. RLB1-9]